MDETSIDGSVMTAQSIIYRKRASDLGKRAEREADSQAIMTLLHEAVSWIQLAENEELLQQGK